MSNPIISSSSHSEDRGNSKQLYRELSHDQSPPRRRKDSNAEHYESDRSNSHHKASHHDTHRGRDRDYNRHHHKHDRYNDDTHSSSSRHPKESTNDQHQSSRRHRHHDDHHDDHHESKSSSSRHHYDSSKSRSKHASTRATQSTKSTKPPKSTKSTKKSHDNVIKFDDHLNPALTPEEIRLKLSTADPKRIDHASFITKFNPTYLKALAMAKTNFYTDQEKKTLQLAAQKRVQAANLLLQQSLSPHENHSQHDNTNTTTPTPPPTTTHKLATPAEIEAMSQAVKKFPNYFATDLLLTIGGGSVFKGQSATTYSGVPGQGATSQLPTNLTQDVLHVKTINMDSLQSQQKAEKNPTQDFLSAIQQVQSQSTTSSSSLINTSDNPTQQPQITTHSIDIAMARYKEPADKIIPNKFSFPITVPQTTIWYLSIYDTATNLFQHLSQIDSTAVNSITAEPQAVLAKLVEHQQETGEYYINPIQIPKSSPLLSLQTQSVYRIGSDQFRNDIVLPALPQFSQPTLVSFIKPSDNTNTAHPSPLDTLATTHPDLKMKLELSSQQTQHSIDTIWNSIISKNSTIQPIHCILQFRLKSQSVTNNQGKLIQMDIPTPYIFIPNSSSLLHDGPQCYFREPSAQSPTGFMKTPIPTNRFVEIMENDVIIVGDSHYELMFLPLQVDNKNTTLQ